MQYMKKYIKNIVPATFMMLALGATSCIGDLDVDPIDPNIDTNVDLNGLFNKCYANMALAGNGGANGDCDKLTVLVAVKYINCSFFLTQCDTT